MYRGETASLLCNISVRGGPAGLRLATSWWVERPEDPELSSAPAQLVGGMGQDGVAKLGVRPGGGPVSVELVGPRSHRLRLHSLGPEDEGIYHCAPSAWVQHADYSWYQVGSARSGPVTVYPYLHGECLPRHPPDSPPSSRPTLLFPPFHLTLLLLSLLLPTSLHTESPENPALLPQRPSAQSSVVEVDESREGREWAGRAVCLGRRCRQLDKEGAGTSGRQCVGGSGTPG